MTYAAYAGYTGDDRMGLCRLGTGWYYRYYWCHGGYYDLLPVLSHLGTALVQRTRHLRTAEGSMVYGGVGFGARYNPRRTYARGAFAYGPYESRCCKPITRTGTYAAPKVPVSMVVGARRRCSEGNWASTSDSQTVRKHNSSYAWVYRAE